MYQESSKRFIRIDNKSYPLEEVLKALGIEDMENRRVELCLQIPKGELRAGICRYNPSGIAWINTCLVLGQEQENSEKLDRIDLVEVSQEGQASPVINLLIEDSDQEEAVQVDVDTRPKEERWDDPSVLLLKVLHQDVTIRPKGKKVFRNKKNTKISYLYRDSSNYKVHNHCIVSGTFSPEEIQEIITCLDMGEYFKPELVGLPAERFSTYDPELDHSWMELSEEGFEETNAAATEQLTAKELLENFRKNKGHWDV